MAINFGGDFHSLNTVIIAYRVIQYRPQQILKLT